MRRFFLACSLFFLLCASFFHMEILGFLLKVVAKSQANSLLAYRDIHFEAGSLILKDVVLFDIKADKSSYFLHSEKISLKTNWKWPFSFFIHAEKPHILISADHFKNNSLETSKSRFKWSVQVEEGVLEWVDNSIPSSQFSLLARSEQSLEMGMSWKQGVLEVKKKGTSCLAEWSNLPFDFLLMASEWSGFSLPLSETQGTISGQAELDLGEKKISIVTTGNDLSFQWQKVRFGGSLLFEGTWKENSIEKIRLSLEEGNIRSFPSEIRDIKSHLTYQAGLGIKVAGQGTAMRESLGLGIEWEGKSFTHRDQLEWAEGTATFGNAIGTVRWNERGGWTLNWEDFGVEEIAILQGFAMKFAPVIGEWNWRSGTVRGEMSFQEGLKAPSLNAIQLKDVEGETNLFAFEAKRASYRAGDWELEEFNLLREDMALRGNGKWHSELEGHTVALTGDIAGLRFAGTGEIDGETFILSIPRFEGDLPPCLWPESRGKIEAIGSGLEVRGSWDSIEDWFLSCRVTEGFTTCIHTLNCTLSDFEFSLLANPDSIDILAAKGRLSAPLGEHIFNTSFFAPRIQWKGASSLFDLRLHDGAIDLLRLKGTKESEQFQLDSSYSHLFGQPIALKNAIWKKGTFSLLDLEAEIDWPLFESYLRRLGLDLWKGFSKLEKVHFAGHLADEKMAFSLAAPTFHLKENAPLGWNFSTEKVGNLWNSKLAIGATNCHCAVEYKEGSLRVNDGRVTGPAIAFDFEGTVNRKLEGALILKKIWADLKHLPEVRLEGNVEGQAQVCFTKEEFQSDLDLSLKEALYEGFSFENSGPLHLYYSSLQGTRVKGIDCRIHKETFEAHAKMDLLKFEKLQNRWTIQKAKTHIPSDFLEIPFFDQGGYLDCLADLSFSSDLSEWVGTVKEALLPIGGSIRHVKDLRFFNKGNSFFSKAFVHHKAKWAKLSLEMIRSSPLRGRFFLEEPEKGENPLSIDWTYEKESGLSILSIEGAFAGIDASFHAFETGQLIGSTRLDFRRLSEWLPEGVAKGFEELKIGKGYELKGNLQIDPEHLSQISFQGIFSGKQVELAGFQFRTLLARADLSPNFYRIYDLKISDSAGLLKIDDIQIKQEAEQPWTIEIPKFIIEELRPSLLVKPGEEPGPVSPLVLRQLKMFDFHGLLDDGKTWLGHGEVSFINSFKREQTVFDLPANVLGRIVGLDLELLIPVQGELTFDLRDGYFNLGELQQAYSEGKRSEFFLVQTESDIPRMDLDGNLQILVKMKQFVLFSLTEAFMISIEGKLNDPHFSLQKKKRFL